MDFKDSLQLSVLDLTPIYRGADAGTALQQSVLLAQTAERLGFTRYWVPEHHDMPELASSCPEVLLAHIGARTETIRIGSGAVLLPHYKPYKVAEAFHLLATLYPGRIDLGIGRAPGGSAHATMALNDHFLEGVRQLPDSLQALSDLLRNEFMLDGQPVVARPTPLEPPVLWLLGTNVKSAHYAAKLGVGYAFGHFMSDQVAEDVISAYKREFQPSSMVREPKVIVAVGVVCAATEAEAKLLAAEGAAWFRPRVADSVLEAEEAEAAFDRRTIVGNPPQVLEQLRQLQQHLGVDEFMIVTNIPDYAKRLRSYELIAGAVTGGTLTS